MLALLPLASLLVLDPAAPASQLQLRQTQVAQAPAAPVVVRAAARPGDPRNRQRPAPPPRHNPRGASLSRVSAACSDLVVSSADRDRCTRIAMDARYDVTVAIDACRDLVVGARDRLQCVQSVAAAPVDPSATLALCKDLVVGSADRLQCADMVSAGAVAPWMLSSCKDFVVGSKDRLTCVGELGAVRRRNPREVVAHCKSAHVGSSQRLACLRSFR